MKLSGIAICTVAASNFGLAAAHTFIWGVFVNGVDQGTFNGVRVPAFNGPPPTGYANSPVKDLDSIDLRCNVMGDTPTADWIQVQPGDNITLDWHHNTRTATDDVIASSHVGPIMIYLSPYPPFNNSFVKIFEEGKMANGSKPFAPGTWASTDDLAKNHGHMNVRIPAGLRAGSYLMRAEVLALHEADDSYATDPIRGAQFYPDCVQLNITGDGTVDLPEGVSFPGAYSYDDPGILYDVYCSTKTKTTTPCQISYAIPGPTVWSGAWQETTNVDVGPVTGATIVTAWSTWIEKSVVTSASLAGARVVKLLGTSDYVASWPTAAATAVAAAAPNIAEAAETAAPAV